MDQSKSQWEEDSGQLQSSLYCWLHDELVGSIQNQLTSLKNISYSADINASSSKTLNSYQRNWNSNGTLYVFFQSCLSHSTHPTLQKKGPLWRSFDCERTQTKSIHWHSPYTPVLCSFEVQSKLWLFVVKECCRYWGFLEGIFPRYSFGNMWNIWPHHTHGREVVSHTYILGLNSSPSLYSRKSSFQRRPL